MVSINTVTQTGREFKIDPEFRDKIPPLTDAEFEQLKENILADGEVYEPICVWNGTIVDGHNRWKIIQEHPEIQFRTIEMEFSNKWEAFAWMYKKQLGRRNLSDEQKTYLMGKRNEAEKLAHGGDRKSKSKMDLEPKGRTAQKIADEYGVGYGTVIRAEGFAKGIDTLKQVSPEAANMIFKGGSGATKAEVQELPKKSSEEVKDFAESVVSGEIKKKHKPKAPVDPEAAAKRKADRELENWIHQTAQDMRSGNRGEYTQKELVRDIALISERFISDIQQELELRKKVIRDVDEIVEVLVECEKRLADIETKLTNGGYTK